MGQKRSDPLLFCLGEIVYTFTLFPKILLGEGKLKIRKRRFGWERGHLVVQNVVRTHAY